MARSVLPVTPPDEDVFGGLVYYDLHERFTGHPRMARTDPVAFESFLVPCGVKVLSPWITRQVSHAQALVAALCSMPRGTSVRYRRLGPDDDAVVLRQMSAHRAECNFTTTTRQDRALRRVRLFAVPVSLRGTRAYVEHAVSVRHRAVPAALSSRLGITEDCSRVSPGIQDRADPGGDLVAVPGG